MNNLISCFGFGNGLISRVAILHGLIFCFCGCSSLVLEERTPAEINLSGHWILNSLISETLEPRNDQGNDGSSVRILSEGIMRPDIADPFVFISHDFHILEAKKISIELDLNSAGIDYSPGVYRDITFGERRRGLWNVYAGWEEEELVIVSKADGLDVVERFSMIDRERMQVVVNIRVEKDERRLVRMFDRSL